jgi:acyl carrier protein
MSDAMTNDAVFQKVAGIIRSVLDQPSLEITPATSAADVEKWDSFNHINITVATEMEFGIKFKTAEIEELRNVGELVAVVEKKLAAKKKGR